MLNSKARVTGDDNAGLNLITDSRPTQINSWYRKLWWESTRHVNPIFELSLKRCSLEKWWWKVSRDRQHTLPSFLTGRLFWWMLVFLATLFIYHRLITYDANGYDFQDDHWKERGISSLRAHLRDMVYSVNYLQNIRRNIWHSVQKCEGHNKVDDIHGVASLRWITYSSLYA